MYCKTILFLVNDTALPSDNPLRFRKNLLKQIYNKIIIIYDRIDDGKLQYDIDREAAKTSALSSGKIGKYEYLTGEENLHSSQKQMIEQTKFAYFPLEKAFGKQIKTIEDQGEKQIKAIQNQGEIKTIEKYYYNDKKIPLISKQKDIFNKLVDKRLEEITNLDKNVNPNDLIYKSKGPTADAAFNKFDNIISFIDKITEGKISLANVKKDQIKIKSDLSEVKEEEKNKLKKQKKAFV